MSSARPTDMDFYDEGERWTDGESVVEIVGIHSCYIVVEPVRGDRDARSVPVHEFAARFSEVESR